MRRDAILNEVWNAEKKLGDRRGKCAGEYEERRGGQKNGKIG